MVCLPIVLEPLEIIHVLYREVVPLDGLLIEIQAPDHRHLLLSTCQLLIELGLVEILQDGVDMLHSMVVVLHVVEDATDVVHCEGLLLVEVLLGVGIHVVLEQDQVVVEGLQAFVSKLVGIGAVLANQLEELEVRVDGETLRLNDCFIL